MKELKRKYQGPPYIIDKTELAADQAMPSIMFRVLGQQALSNEIIKTSKCRDPREFLEMHNLEATARWLLIHLPNLSPSDLPGLESEFVELNVQGNDTDRYDWSIVSDIGRVPKRKMKTGSTQASQANETHDGSSQNEANHEAQENVQSTKCTLQSLCSSTEILESEEYPTTGISLDALPGSGEGYSIDCEMCLAGQAYVLTRIAVIRFSDSALLLDQLVKPDVEITDYVTQYSGITPEMLENVTFTLADAQAWLRSHIGQSDVLIGHSLNNDLNVLGVTHPHIVDTALLFPHYLGPSYHSSLRYLARKVLGTGIQAASEAGHNPIEDALTCERLVKWVMQHGREYTLIDTDTMAAFSTLLARDGFKSTIIGAEPPLWDADGAASHLIGTEASECVELSLKSLKTSKYVCTTIEKTDPSVLGQQLNLLMRQVPSKTLVTILFGTNYGLHKEIQRLRKRKTTFSKEFRTQNWDSIQDPWTSEDDTLLKNTINKLGSVPALVRITVDAEEMQQWPEYVKLRVAGKIGPKIPKSKTKTKKTKTKTKTQPESESESEPKHENSSTEVVN